mgnify:CR=1 FL=1
MWSANIKAIHQSYATFRIRRIFLGYGLKQNNFILGCFCVMFFTLDNFERGLLSGFTK